MVKLELVSPVDHKNDTGLEPFLTEGFKINEVLAQTNVSGPKAKSASSTGGTIMVSKYMDGQFDGALFMVCFIMYFPSFLNNIVSILIVLIKELVLSINAGMLGSL